MKNLRLLMFLFLGVAIATATSCKKDEEDSGGGDNPTTKTCYVTKFTNDDGSYSMVEYNSDNKIVKASDFDDTGAADGYFTIDYTNGKASKMMTYKTNGDLESKMEMSYDAQGKMEQTDIYTDPGTGFTKVGFYKYTFSGDDLSSISLNIDLSGQMIEVSKFEYTFDAGNVKKMKEYSYDFSSLSMKLSGTTEYLYDGKMNPMHGIGIDYIFAEVQMMSKANITKSTYSDDTGAVMDDASYNTVYEYNDNKYPTKATATAFDNSDTEVTTYEYDCK